MPRSDSNNILNLDNFVPQKVKPQKSLQNLISYLVREVNKQKLDYDQLKYVFKAVRSKCNIEKCQQSLNGS